MTRGITSETLSAALDGECSPGELDRLLEELEGSPQLRLEWSRLCLARDAAAAARVKLGQRCICEGVMAEVGREPAPSWTSSGKVVEMVPRRRELFSWRPMAALAAAASVAGVALISYHNITVSKIEVPTQQVASASSPTTSPLTSSPVSVPAPVETAALGAPVTTVSLREQPQAAIRATSNALSSEDMQQLDGYLIDYSNYRAGAGMGDALGYARFAAHTAEYRADNR
jgi:negative regulator of sigma E activity